MKLSEFGKYCKSYQIMGTTINMWKKLSKSQGQDCLKIDYSCQKVSKFVLYF